MWHPCGRGIFDFWRVLNMKGMIVYMDDIKNINGQECYIHRHGKESTDILPVFYWGIVERDEASIERIENYIEKMQPQSDYLLVAYKVNNWNDDFSPWKEPPVFGQEGFSGNGQETSEWLINECIPYIESENNGYITGGKQVLRFCTGYSLAGLFSLWAYYESDIFDGAVSCSGSLWFPGWLDYIEKKDDKLAALEKTNYVYLSLGDKEEKTRNSIMATVGDNTRIQHSKMCAQSDKIVSVLEWNKGGHFSEPDVRVAKGIMWVCSQL